MSDITEKAQVLLAGRIASIQALEEQRSKESAARDALAVAEHEVSAAWSAATAAGWTPAELKKLGFTAPPTRRGGRPKSPRLRPTVGVEEDRGKGTDVHS